MRKKLNHNEILKHDIKLRVNQFHFDRLNKLLSSSHYRNMSELLRKIVCEQKITIYTKDDSLDITMTELTKIRKELKAIGTNLNQIAKQINGTTDKNKTLFLFLESTDLLKQTQHEMEKLFRLISQLARKWLQE